MTGRLGSSGKYRNQRDSERSGMFEIPNICNVRHDGTVGEVAEIRDVRQDQVIGPNMSENRTESGKLVMSGNGECRNRLSNRGIGN
eukprot:10983045-Lingulodinium_polyedra.AAC.1